MEQKLIQQEAGNVQETYASLQQEVEIKTKKLKKLFAKLQATKAEIQDLQEEHVNERQTLEQTQNELLRELKLKMLIIDNFIPPEEKNKLQNRAVFDEDEDTWNLQPLTKAGVQTMAKRPVSAMPGSKRAVSEYAKMAAAVAGHIRYKGENILAVELDMPNRTTRDYEGPAVAPKIQAALDAALQDEEDIDIDGSPAVFSNKPRTSKVPKRKAAGVSRPKTAKQKEQEQFPTSRGLVPKN